MPLPRPYAFEGASPPRRASLPRCIEPPLLHLTFPALLRAFPKRCPASPQLEPGRPRNTLILCGPGRIFPGLESRSPPPPPTSRHFHEIFTISAVGSFFLSLLAAASKPDGSPLRGTAFKIQIPGPHALGILHFYKALPKESDVQPFEEPVTFGTHNHMIRSLTAWRYGHLCICLISPSGLFLCR